MPLSDAALTQPVMNVEKSGGMAARCARAVEVGWTSTPFGRSSAACSNTERSADSSNYFRASQQEGVGLVQRGFRVRRQTL